MEDIFAGVVFHLVYVIYLPLIHVMKSCSLALDMGLFCIVILTRLLVHASPGVSALVLWKATVNVGRTSTVECHPIRRIQYPIDSSGG